MPKGTCKKDHCKVKQKPLDAQAAPAYCCPIWLTELVNQDMEKYKEIKATTYINKLGLDGSGMDSSIMEHMLDSAGQFHILIYSMTADMCGCNNPAPSQLPDVALMDSINSFHLQKNQKKFQFFTSIIKNPKKSNLDYLPSIGS